MQGFLDSAVIDCFFDFPIMADYLRFLLVIGVYLKIHFR